MEEANQTTEKSPAESYTVVGVRFKRAGKIYYFDPNNLNLKLDQEVIVETARGMEYGKVKIGPKEVPATGSHPR